MRTSPSWRRPRVEPDPDDPMAVMARSQYRFGFATGVVTLGSEGAWDREATRPGDPVRVAGQRVRVIDTVGAGDTFMAGFLAAFAGGVGVDHAVRHGVAAAAYVCTRQGPQPPTRAELDTFMTG